MQVIYFQPGKDNQMMEIKENHWDTAIEYEFG